MSAYSSFSSMNFSWWASWSNSAGEICDRFAANNINERSNRKRESYIPLLASNTGCEGCEFSRLGPAAFQIPDQNAGLPVLLDEYCKARRMGLRNGEERGWVWYTQNLSAKDERDVYAPSFWGFVADFPGLGFSSCVRIWPASHLIGINGRGAWA
ncbi:hypothetical protein B0H17DRAFT_1131259 [Mycena rosella]|uniref:Uncharacterized protein n=1 Tax=Mycena rosella TaxID=1033263 RepID=A0AAD7DMW6_MYCRO|nr:hypothetical protein B0H17DRAFT_1131259 [Mycena rosella]